MILFAHRYAAASSAYATMVEQNLKLKHTDSGFREIAEILARRGYRGSFEQIQSITGKPHAKLGFTEDGRVGPSVEIVLEFANGQKQVLKVGDLANDIAEYFLDPQVMIWGRILFYFGLLLAAVGGFCEITMSKRGAIET